MKKFILIFLCLLSFNVYSQDKPEGKITNRKCFTITDYYKDYGENEKYRYACLYCNVYIEKEYISNTCYIIGVQLGKLKIIELPSVESINIIEDFHTKFKNKYINYPQYTNKTCEDVEAGLNNYLKFLVFTKEKIFTDSTISNDYLEYKCESFVATINQKERKIDFFSESDINNVIEFIPKVQKKIDELKNTFN